MSYRDAFLSFSSCLLIFVLRLQLIRDSLIFCGYNQHLICRLLGCGLSAGDMVLGTRSRWADTGSLKTICRTFCSRRGLWPHSLYSMQRDLDTRIRISACMTFVNAKFCVWYTNYSDNNGRNKKRDDDVAYRTAVVHVWSEDINNAMIKLLLKSTRYTQAFKL